jgi:hypothetical protein
MPQAFDEQPFMICGIVQEYPSLGIPRNLWAIGELHKEDMQE